MEFIERWLPNLYSYWYTFLANCAATFQMFIISGAISFVFGMIFGVLLIVFKKDGIKENKTLYTIVSIFINLFRSIPFVVLLVFLIPFTRAFVGTAIGVKGAIIPLIFGTVPFFSRQVETALENVDPGKAEAARSMGSGTFGLIFRVYLHESVPELIRVTTITAISLVGLTTMAGAVGGGGLGQMAINYGYNRWQDDVMISTVVAIIVIVQIIQLIGDLLSRLVDHRAR